MEKNYFLINVNGKYGYSMVVFCNAKDGDAAISMAADENLFAEDTDIQYAYAEEADKETIQHFTKNNSVIEI